MPLSRQALKPKSPPFQQNFYLEAQIVAQRPIFHKRNSLKIPQNSLSAKALISLEPLSLLPFCSYIHSCAVLGTADHLTFVQLLPPVVPWYRKNPSAAIEASKNEHWADWRAKRKRNKNRWKRGNMIITRRTDGHLPHLWPRLRWPFHEAPYVHS